MSSPIDFSQELNAEQYAVVSQGDGRCLVLAGAGSGKTRAVTYRVAWLFAHGVAPDQVLLLTFTNKAAKEMITRVQGLVGAYPTGMWAGTFHAIANRALRTWGDRTPLGRDFSILDEDDALELLKRAITDAVPAATGKGGGRFPSPAVVRSLLSYATNARLPVGDVLERRAPSFTHLADDCMRIAAAYAHRKRQARAADFDDLLLEFHGLLHNDAAARAALAGQFAHVLVDEFQDTNAIQADLADALSSVHGNLIAVGDDAQSIYGFRAANVRNILDFPARYPGTTIFRLEENYRSTPQILAVANAVIAKNTEQFSKHLVAARAVQGDLPQVIPAADDRHEAEIVVQEILAAVAKGTPLSHIAVLVRAAFHSQALEFAFAQHHIPYDYRGGQRFFSRAHVKDVLAHLRLVQNPRDTTAWLRVVRLRAGFGSVTATKIADGMTGFDTLAEALAQPPALSPRLREGWAQIATTMHSVLHAASASAAVRVIAGAQWYQDYLQAEYPNFRERLEDVEQFARFAEEYTSIAEFLDAVALTSDTAEEQAAEDRVVVSTIHQAKGLEWDTVIIVHLNEGSFPNQRAMGEDGGMDEERRLFYVAVTRARRRLLLTYPLMSGRGAMDFQQPSSFLNDIPADALEVVRVRSQPRQRFAAAPRSSWGQEEPVVVMDALGERTTPRPAPTSYLSDVGGADTPW